MKRSITVAALATALALGMTACGASNEDGGGNIDSKDAAKDAGVSGSLKGAGASSQEKAMTAWKAGFQTGNKSAKVDYSSVGSGAGRKQFLDKAVSFAGTDAYLDGEEIAKAKQRCGGDYVEVPVYVSPIAIAYKISGVNELKLDAPTLAKIFARKITKWDDPAIAKLNEGTKLPSTTITVVNRSDKSGTTENFTDYLHQAAPAEWTHKPSGSWPVQGGTAAQGTSGVVAAISGGDGTIGYADESQIGGLKTVQVKIGDSFQGPTAEGAAKTLEVSQIKEGRDKTDMAFDIDRKTTKEGAYPVILVSYQVACQKYENASEGQLVKAWLNYVVSPAGQRIAQKSAGNAPLSEETAKQAMAAIDTIVTK